MRGASEFFRSYEMLKQNRDKEHDKYLARALSEVLEDESCVRRAKPIKSRATGLILWQIPGGNGFCADCGFRWREKLPWGLHQDSDCPRPFDHEKYPPILTTATKKGGMMAGAGSSSRPLPPLTCAEWEPDEESMGLPRKEWRWHWRLGRIEENWILIENDGWGRIVEETSKVLRWLEEGCPANRESARLSHKWFTPEGARERYPSVLPERRGAA